MKTGKENSQGKVLITGATKGIGLRIASLLVTKGWEVVGTGRNPKGGMPAIQWEHLDLSEPAGVARLAEAVGPVDVLINNAGHDLYGAVEELSLEEYRFQMEVNFFGAVRATQAFLPAMLSQGSGRILNISSIGGLIALPYNSAYAASKYALEGYTESLRYEVKSRGVWVSLIEPGAVATDTLAGSLHGPQSPSGISAEMLKHMEKMGTASKTSPEQVAQKVLQAIKAKKPKLRYSVGADAFWLPKLKSMLPGGMMEGMIQSSFPVI
jgi:short-subunit dehydrogenase